LERGFNLLADFGRQRRNQVRLQGIGPLAERGGNLPGSQVGAGVDIPREPSRLEGRFHACRILGELHEGPYTAGAYAQSGHNVLQPPEE
jgi:hypothetical protein